MNSQHVQPGKKRPSGNVSRNRGTSEAETRYEANSISHAAYENVPAGEIQVRAQREPL
jgi:hypothetical protein